MTFTFVRHAESNHNRNRQPFEFDSPLTTKGREDASKIGGVYDYALISFMQRTRETFELSHLDAPIIEYSSLCREHFSFYDSLAHMNVGERNIHESNDDFEFRMSLLKLHLERLALKHKRILIVTHQGVIGALTPEHHAYNGEMVPVEELIIQPHHHHNGLK